MILFLYNVVLIAALVAGAPWWLWRMATTHKYREGLLERLGRVPPRLVSSPTSAGVRPLIWLHAVSVGEVLAVTRLVGALEGALPDYLIAISTTTRTSQALARERFGANRVFYCPLDLVWAVPAYLNALQPSLLILAETEFWPNLLSACFRRKIPIAVVNARVSHRSWPRYQRLRRLWRPLLSRLSRVLAQSQTDADRLFALGCRPDRVSVAGNLKFDVRAVQEAEATRKLKSMAAGLRLIVAGSTLEGEESALLEVWPTLLAADSQLVLVLAPRHPERFSAVAALLEKSGLPWCRRSDWPSEPLPAQPAPYSLRPGTIVLLDTIGELASVYSLASVAFVGGSLVPAGGHNPLEPAQFAVPIVMGPHYANFAAITDSLRGQDALRIAAKDELAAEAHRTPSRPRRRRSHGLPRQAGLRPPGRRHGSLRRGDPRVARGKLRPGAHAMTFTPAARPLLWPLVPVYRLGLALRDLQLRSGLKPVRQLKWPVVSIGNLSTGGSGKTPLTIALAKALSARGLHVDVLSRGYGRRSALPLPVNPGGTAEDFGDEPLVIAREAQVPVYVASERYEAGLLAERDAAQQAGVHLLDDGFQHRQLARDVDILLLSRRDLSDHLLPVGNLREPLRAAERAQVIAILADDTDVEGEIKAHGWKAQIWRLRRVMEIPPLDVPIAAFCGIARPAQFFQGLESAGVKLAVRAAFPDHHRYTARDLERLTSQARGTGATALLTTEKDRMRLGGLSTPQPIQTVKLRIEINDEDAAVDWLMDRIEGMPRG